MTHRLLGMAGMLAVAGIGSLGFTLYVSAEVPAPPGEVRSVDSPAARSEELATDLSRAVAAVERLDSLRASLAGTFAAEEIRADRETFARVCAPVGEEARRIAGENGWAVEQLATRYRNPAHAADRKARGVMTLMEDRPDLMGLWVRSPGPGESTMRYFRRIEVRTACLACHGERGDRPEFVEESYPEDRAYGFSVGDLRGVYSVTIPADGALAGPP